MFGIREDIYELHMIIMIVGGKLYIVIERNHSVIFYSPLNLSSWWAWPTKRGEEQNREEGEMAQTKLGEGRNRGKK